MKYIITESRLNQLIFKFLGWMDHPKEVCHVETKLNDNGDVVLIVIVKRKLFKTFGSGTTTRTLREYYTNKVSDYIGITPSVFFEVGDC